MVRAPSAWPVLLPLAAGALAVAAVAPGVASARPATSYTYAVNSTADGHDANPGGSAACATTGGACTLRAAVEAASARAAGSDITIDLPAGTYDLSLGSLTVTANRVSIDGAGASSTVIDAGGASRDLAVDTGATVTLRRVAVAGGNAGGDGYGGGVLNAGTLVVAYSTVSGDTAASGGGLSNAGGQLTVEYSVVSDDNDGGGYGGGGIQNGGITDLPGTVNVIDTTFSDDTASDDGGAILNGQNGHPDSIRTPAQAPRSWQTRRAGAAAGRRPAPALTTSRVTVSGSTFSSDSTDNAGGGVANEGGVTTISTSSFTNDTAGDGVGGAIYNAGQLTVSRSTLTGNTACYGGAIELIDGSSASGTVDQSTLSGNVGCVGGAIDVTGPLTVDQSTLAANSAPEGGAVEVEGSSSGSFTNSTFAGNRAGAGNGAIQTYGCSSGTLSFVTFAGNSDAVDLSCADVIATGTIFSGSTGPNCDGAHPAESTGYNLDSGTSCGLGQATDLTGRHARLGLLADNGGDTETEMPRAGSAALGHGGTAATGCPPVDQRGVKRPQGPACDIGAVERQA
jgi:CSLREA domain-containing protein